MPYSLDIRRVFLETLQIPLILLSILFALYHNNYRIANNIVVTNDRSLDAKTITILISGIFLGLAIFTKAFNMIPLIGFLIYFNSKNEGFKALGLWIIPIIAIPCILTAYAILSGDIDKWIDGIDYQTIREGIGILLYPNRIRYQ